MELTRLLLLFGGESSEHTVSISSARNVFAAVDRNKYEIFLCYVDQKGKWWLLDEFEGWMNTKSAQQLIPVLGDQSFKVGGDGATLRIDVILPILHGKNGEDGSVQGLAQLLHIPIVGCDVTASSIGMDKVVSKQIVAAHGITIVPYHIYHAGDEMPDFGDVTYKLGSTLFIKPSRSGSSVGVSKVTSKEQFEDAIALALESDKTVLIEKAITARELEVAVLGTPPNERISVIGEIKPGAEFYSYDDKYATDSTSLTIIPADIPQQVSDEITAAAGKVYRALGCSGLARIDFFLSDEGTLNFNEINTLPGFTNISMYPKLWMHVGMSYSELIESLIDDALSNGTIELT